MSESLATSLEEAIASAVESQLDAAIGEYDFSDVARDAVSDADIVRKDDFADMWQSQWDETNFDFSSMFPDEDFAPRSEVSEAIDNELEPVQRELGAAHGDIAQLQENVAELQRSVAILRSAVMHLTTPLHIVAYRKLLSLLPWRS